ncbi:hypothetical protein [Nocardia grenadensis]|uniref:hypothetical protein n=1 Tax=Nocardia grenadensis TaxID=931537 RepID=UPI003D74FC81
MEAETLLTTTGTILTVYRSVLVTLVSEMYAPVAKFLAEHSHELYSEAEHRDTAMQWNTAIRSIYSIGARRETLERQAVCLRPSTRSNLYN